MKVCTILPLCRACNFCPGHDHLSADTIINNGHTIQVNIGDSSVLGYGNTNYRLLQFHFHHPSEHLIGGKSFPMEVHFVHANAASSLAVIGALMTGGRANPVFNK